MTPTTPPSRESLERRVERDDFLARRGVRWLFIWLAGLGLVLLSNETFEAVLGEEVHAWNILIGGIFLGAGALGIQRGDASAALKDAAQVFGEVTTGLATLKPWSRGNNPGRRAEDQQAPPSADPDPNVTEPADPALQDFDRIPRDKDDDRGVM